MVDLCNVSRRRKEEQKKKKKRKKELPSPAVSWRCRLRFRFNGLSDRRFTIIRSTRCRLSGGWQLSKRAGAALRERRSSPAQPRNPQSSSWYLVSRTFLHHRYRDRDRGHTECACARAKTQKIECCFSVYSAAK